MKRQILIINGGNVFEDHEGYIKYIQTRPVALNSFRVEENWKNALHSVLGSEYDVLIPQMPNKWNARFEEWKIWFERIVTLLEDEVILIGHSLGGIFLAKYLSENVYPKKIKATFLLAAPFVVTNSYPLADFVINEGLPGMEVQAGKIFIYHSEEDTVVPAVCAEKYKKALPTATLRLFKGYGHLNPKEFPEIVADIRTL